MIRLFWMIGLLCAFLGATEVKIASYNVENLFDMKDDGTEYEEYIPDGDGGWTDDIYRIKLRHTAQVIKDIKADLIGLQEIESETALKDLKAELSRQGLYYPYYAFAKTRNSAINVALLSRYPIRSALKHPVNYTGKFRDILEAKVDINGQSLRVFVNHWKSKRGPESERVRCAKRLQKRLQELPENEAYVLLGDFNSDVEEYRTFVKNRKFNDTDGITGINHILQTVNEDESPITYTDLEGCSNCRYNLWYDLPSEERWSHQFKKYHEALDNIIIPHALADGKGIEYVQGSFRRFDAPYLFYKGKPYRWQLSRGRPKHHIGEGYSDHLPIFALFRL